MRTKLLHTLIAGIISIAILGCAATPSQRFPNASAEFSKHKTVDVYIDVSVLSDIGEDYPGFDRETNLKPLNTLTETVVTQFSDQQLQIGNLATTCGLAIQNIAHTTRVDFSKDYESTGEQFEVALDQNGTPAGIDLAVSNFLMTLSKKAEQVSYSKPTARKKRWAQKTGTDLSDNPVKSLVVPEPLSQSSNLIALVRLQGTRVSSGKSVGVGILTGVVSAVLSGGTMVMVSSPVSQKKLELVIFDPSSKTVLWQNSVMYTSDIDDIEDLKEATLELFDSMKAIKSGKEA